MDEKKVMTIFIIDDDHEVNQSLRWLMESVGYRVATYANANQFLQSYHVDDPGCLVLDVRMPEMSGLELQEILYEKKIMLPLIFITAHADVAMAVRAMKRGAIDFLTKPVNNQVMLDSVNRALRWDLKCREQLAKQQKLLQMQRELTPREHEVMQLMMQGYATKTIAGQLGISPNTAELHRAKVMKKMKVKSLAELVHLQVHNIIHANNIYPWHFDEAISGKA